MLQIAPGPLPSVVEAALFEPWPEQAIEGAHLAGRGRLTRAAPHDFPHGLAPLRRDKRWSSAVKHVLDGWTCAWPLDFDATPLSPEYVASGLLPGLALGFHTTARDSPPCRHFRFWLFFSRPLRPSTAIRAIKSALPERLDGLDGHSFDEGRHWFLPPQSAEIWFRPGSALDVRPDVEHPNVLSLSAVGRKRLAVAVDVGARIRGRPGHLYAEVACPVCPPRDRPSVWWPLEPSGRYRHASCRHRKTHRELEDPGVWPVADLPRVLGVRP